MSGNYEAASSQESTTPFWKTGSQFESEAQYAATLPEEHVLVDGDIIAYRCSAAADGRYYEVDGQRFKYMKEAKSYAERKSIPNKDIVTGYEPEPVENALHSVALNIDTVKNWFLSEKKVNPQIKVFLSGESNFRYDIFPDYKKSRKNVRKPEHLVACKEYLQNQFGAFLYEGYEADDLIGMTVTALQKQNPGGRTIWIASVDKDFVQLARPGVAYLDFTKPAEAEYSEWEGLQYFYKQILTGDKSDDIPGLPKVGPQTAIEILKGAKTELDLLMLTLLAYRKYFQCSLEAAVDVVKRRGQLLYLMREQDVLWHPPCFSEAIEHLTTKQAVEEKAA